MGTKDKAKAEQGASRLNIINISNLKLRNEIRGNMR